MLLVEADTAVVEVVHKVVEIPGNSRRVVVLGPDSVVVAVGPESVVVEVLVRCLRRYPSWSAKPHSPSLQSVSSYPVSSIQSSPISSENHQ